MPSIAPTTSRIVLCCTTTMHIIAVCIEAQKGKVTLFNSYPDTNVGGWGKRIVESLLGLLSQAWQQTLGGQGVEV